VPIILYQVFRKIDTAGVQVVDDIDLIEPEISQVMFLKCQDILSMEDFSRSGPGKLDKPVTMPAAQVMRFCRDE